MTQYNSLNVKLSNSQLNKLQSAIKNETGLVLRLSLNMVGNDETNFTNLRKAFANKSSTDIKLSKTQLSKMVQSEGFLGRLLGLLLKTGLPLIKNVIKPLPKSVLIDLGLTASASAGDAEIHKKVLGSGKTIIISNDEMKDINEIVKSLEDSGLLSKGVSETIQNEAKKQKGGLLSMSLGTLGASLLENILPGKGINRAGEGIVSAGYRYKKGRKATTKGHKNKMDF